MTKTALLVSLSLLVLGGYVGTAYPADRAPAPLAQTAPDKTIRAAMSGTAATQRSRQATKPKMKRIGP